MMHYYGNWGFGALAFGMLWMALFWIGLVWFIVWLVRQASTATHQEKSQGEKPIDILKARYAKGNISKREYLEMKKELQR